MYNKWIDTNKRFPENDDLVIGIYITENNNFSFELVLVYGDYWFGGQYKRRWKDSLGNDSSPPDYWIEINHELVDFLGPKKLSPIIKTSRFELMEVE